MILTLSTIHALQSLSHSAITAVCSILHEGGPVVGASAAAIGGGGGRVSSEALHSSEMIDTADLPPVIVHAPSTDRQHMEDSPQIASQCR